MKPVAAIPSVPVDRTPDAGPIHRGGAFALTVALLCAFSSAGTVLLLWQEGLRTWAVPGALFFAVTAAWATWCLIDRWRHHGALPRSHNVLMGALAFDIVGTCRDVAATVFFFPDRLPAGSPTRVCCFVENYASRRRIAHFRIGPHSGLGLREQHRVSLELAAGQAAVYLLPLEVGPEAAADEHDLPVTLKVEKPNGTGVRLPGTRRHLYDLWTLHFAAPFTVETPPAGAPRPTDRVPRAPEFVLLASVSEPEPRLSALAGLLESSL